MIKCVIIDDEADARFLLSNIIHKNFTDQLEIVAEADTIADGISIIEKYEPQVVFLDIRMREGTGFDLLEKIEDKNFEVVFVTAFDNYAIKAIQFSAFGYLMKPIKIMEFKQLVGTLGIHFSKQKEDVSKRLKVLIENYGDDRKIKKLVIPNMEGFKVVEIEDIIRLEGDRNYTNFIVSEGKKITSTKTLGEYETLLTDFGFFRIHQSTIVNLRHVKGYLKGDGGSVEMTDGKHVQVSRHRKANFVKKFI
ncbi:LytTR family DNA-binding domain-containing protein [Fluviicola sp.]|uniref:LytR/AlgR family response regulator transcription factor n=1 Tax=Fluviicola sp. TaxID=1917219 RepID=UPI00261100F8|nr:LytTR family DNA-binding domain-containing protein [Fluviicola sp.]